MPSSSTTHRRRSNINCCCEWEIVQIHKKHAKRIAAQTRGENCTKFIVDDWQLVWEKHSSSRRRWNIKYHQLERCVVQPTETSNQSRSTLFHVPSSRPAFNDINLHLVATRVQHTYIVQQSRQPEQMRFTINTVSFVVKKKMCFNFVAWTCIAERNAFLCWTFCFVIKL